MAIIIDGKKTAQEIRNEIKEQVVKLKQEKGITPGLAVVIVGNNPASRVYVNMKKRACEETGINSFEHVLEENVSEQELLDLVEKLNNDNAVNGILVQLPLPSHINEDKVIEKIKPEKDVDGFHPISVGKMVLGQPCFLSCTPFGIQKLLEKYNIETQGKHVVIVGRSNIVGKPMGMILLQKNKFANATVTFCHSRTKDLAQITKQADIIIAAIGIPEFVKADMVKDNAVVIDVGINRVEDSSSPKGYRIVGDVEFDEIEKKAYAITPVPGGVGPMTIAMLLFNTLKSIEVV
jgi:methylenetetrahydrofolate dehydrogenase (NADP+) / methenyltetrahydrofolate cyclohydrolase